MTERNEKYNYQFHIFIYTPVLECGAESTSAVPTSWRPTRFRFIGAQSTKIEHLQEFAKFYLANLVICQLPKLYAK